MANVVIGGTATGATALPVAGSIDGTNDLLPIYTASATATQAISRNTFLGVTGQPADISTVQTLTNKVINNTNTVTLKDTLFTLQNNSDTTKQAKFQLSGITTGNTRTYTLPDITDTLVSLTASQTMTNKTLTSPTLNTPTITNATISADTVSGYSASTTGTVYGVSVTTGVIASAALLNTVNTAALQNNAVLSGKLGLSNGFTGGVASQANAGSGGGTMYYINLGGLKMLWMVTAGTTASTTYQVTFPTSFFTTIQSITLGPIGSGGTTTGVYVITGTVSNTGFQYYSGTNPQTDYFMVMGT